MKHCVVEYLKKIRESSDRTKYVKDKIEEIDAAMTLKGIEYKDSCSSGVYADMTAENIQMLVELRAEMNEHISSSIELFRGAFAICYGYENRWPVWLHVVEGKTWAAVGKALHTDRDSVRKRANLGYVEIYHAMPVIETKINIPDAIGSKFVRLPEN